jgi:hypothetical protein
VSMQRAGANGVEIGRRQTGPRGGLHRTQGGGDSAARAPHAFAIVFRVDRHVDQYTCAAWWTAVRPSSGHDTRLWPLGDSPGWARGFPALSLYVVWHVRCS